jgi:CheY-like chemotaxis protein
MSTENLFRILVVDDNPAIHDDFRKVLTRGGNHDDTFAQAEARLFGRVAEANEKTQFLLDNAQQGEEALAQVQAAVAAGQPYAVAFVDIRMPPGWDGVETTARLWEADPQLQVVICTAYSDYSWESLLARLHHSDRFLILKKPFDAIEVKQLAQSLTTKWVLARQAKLRQRELEFMVNERTKELQDALAKVKTLSGLLPICASCKKIRDDKGYWNSLEGYISQHSEATFSHGLCPDCTQRFFPEPVEGDAGESSRQPG